MAAKSSNKTAIGVGTKNIIEADTEMQPGLHLPQGEPIAKIDGESFPESITLICHTGGGVIDT